MPPQNWEDYFIEQLSKTFPSKDSIVGIGDDCAVIPEGTEKAWLVTADALVEGVHFLKDQITPKDLGYKTIAVNVSDITAMGGEPKYAFLSLALPTKDIWINGIIEGIKEACEKWNILLLGGDTVGSKRDIFLNLTLIGSAKIEQVKYRHHAQGGDIICVTGYLGDSGGGLKALQEQIIKTEEVDYLIQAHFRPNPQPMQGMWLASHHAVHAMMDISDGLNCDLNRLLKSSQKGAIIEISKLPLSEPLKHISKEQGWDILQQALVGGEDYCLLLTIDSNRFENIQYSFQEKFNSPLFAIGHIIPHPEELVYHQTGKPIQIHYVNYDHFKKNVKH